MAEITIPNDSQRNFSSDTVSISNISEIPMLVSTDHVKLDSNDAEEPPAKKSKVSLNDKTRLLEDRIGSILSCCICLDLSTLAMFQCINGHLMCVSCFNHLLADCKMKDEQTTCPNCRCEISKSNCTRNLAVEKTISELPIQCDYCSKIFIRSEIKIHQSQNCPERPTICDYSLLGCNWNGSYQNLPSHLLVCECPTKTGAQLINTIRAQKRTYDDEKKCLETVVDLLSLNQIGVSDLILKPLRTDDFAAKLYFETSRFTALQYQWQVRARINDNTPHPHTTVTRSLSYQLILKSKITQSIDLKFFILKGPHGDPSTLQIQPIIYHFEFNQNNTETEYLKLPISSQECNRILSSSSISFRLLMVQLDKP
ncbi:unnamed protein product [Rotaria magnacalcarata]|uniref:TRAF-type domain-containing protein n=4 Tax=Rotaria magnacalcarata TaxID=392030 RepID=A0A815BYD5_9BILA|nr:unnamed protein product [Rotaria magnacalcarata]CAF2090555.1 unnamed protein product [Rotaria magnacalcarata]CAF2128609.1 unnamed protein product [Rotaria magnacalcarata]CAF3824267.1 unnamed protein product [Rotaria magnacalcarata]